MQFVRLRWLKIGGKIRNIRPSSMFPWQQFLSEFADNYREIMLDFYDDIVKV